MCQDECQSHEITLNFVVVSFERALNHICVNVSMDDGWRAKREHKKRRENFTVQKKHHTVQKPLWMRATERKRKNGGVSWFNVQFDAVVAIIASHFNNIGCNRNL